MATILVVDDEEPIVDLLADVLAGERHRVLTAHDGREALALAHEQHPDLVVTDAMMPFMDGPALAQRFHSERETRDVPVVLLSAGHVPSARQAGAVAFLSKPFDIAEMVMVVEEVLEGRRCTSGRRGSAC